jgi:DNA-binding GntR family transcriptional regulator
MTDRTAHAPAEPPPAWAPIVRPALQEEIVLRIRQLIEDGALLPGSRIPERQLCAQLGVSRTPLREAFRILASQGLIALEPRRGATVKKLQPDEIDHMFEVLEVLEALAGELACAVMSDADLASIGTLHERMMAAYKRRDRRRFFEINQQIHERIVAGCGNPILVRIYEGLSGQMRRIRYMPRITEAQWRLAVREHAGIMKALEARSRAALGRVLRGHLRTKRERVKTLIAD